MPKATSLNMQDAEIMGLKVAILFAAIIGQIECFNYIDGSGRFIGQRSIEF